MNEDEMLDFVWLGDEYFQVNQGIMKQQNDDGPINIGKIYIHQMEIKRDIKNRFEPVYSIKYDDLIFNETISIKNRLFEDLVDYIDKQKIIYEKKSKIEQILLYNLIYNHGTVNGAEFIVKEKIDFTKNHVPRCRYKYLIS